MKEIREKIVEKLLKNLHYKATEKIQENEKRFYDEVEINGVVASVEYHISYLESPQLELENVDVANEDEYLDAIASYINCKIDDELDIINTTLNQSVKRYQYAY